MSVYSCLLSFTPGNQQVFLRELCAQDELAVTDVGTAGAINLLNRLFVSPSDDRFYRAEQIATADRDRLLAAVYRSTYGSRIDSTITCQFCQEPFDIDFTLDDLLTFSQSSEKGTRQNNDGTYQTAGGWHFRLPTGADELAIMGLSSEESEQMLLQRCLLARNPDTDDVAVQEAMQAIAPLLEMDMAATCPDCGREQPVHFNMQLFLLSRLKNEQQQVVRDIHQLATTYRWTHREITELPRRLRHMYIRLINADSNHTDHWLT